MSFVMARRYRRYRRRRPLKTIRYASETVSYRAQFPQNNQINNYVITLIDPDNSQGLRKVKNLTFTIHLDTQAFTKPFLVAWAIVFVPQGQSAGNILMGSSDQKVSSIYEPNQNVIMSSFMDPNRVSRYRTRLARNLNSGDSIQLVVQTRSYETSSDSIFCDFMLNYAICYN